MLMADGITLVNMWHLCFLGILPGGLLDPSFWRLAWIMLVGVNCVFFGGKNSCPNCLANHHNSGHDNSNNGGNAHKGMQESLDETIGPSVSIIHVGREHHQLLGRSATCHWGGSSSSWSSSLFMSNASTNQRRNTLPEDDAEESRW